MIGLESRHHVDVQQERRYALSARCALLAWTIRQLAYPSRVYFVFSSRRRHTRCLSDWSSDVCSSDLEPSPTGRVSVSPGALASTRNGHSARWRGFRFVDSERVAVWGRTPLCGRKRSHLARPRLAFSLFIGSHFMAADRGAAQPARTCWSWP